MNGTGLQVFDRTNIWLNEIMDELGPDRHFAWHVLGTVLRSLRDQLPADAAIDLGAQLPILVRGTYYDGWHTPAERDEVASADAFLRKVEASLADSRGVSPRAAVNAVFATLSSHVDGLQIAKLRACLGAPIRSLWPEKPALGAAASRNRPPKPARLAVGLDPDAGISLPASRAKAVRAHGKPAPR